MKSSSSLLISLLCVIVFIGCEPKSDEQKVLNRADSLALKEVQLEKTGIYFGKTIKTEIPELVFYPLSSEPFEQIFDGKSKYRSYGSEKYSNKTWNILFVNSTTREKYLLLEDGRGIFNYFQDPNDVRYLSEEEREIEILEQYRDGYLLFEIITEDYNEDGKLDNFDPTYLYLADDDGKNLRLISPSNMDVSEWRFINPNSKIIELRGKLDRNEDAKFNAQDSREVWLVDIDNSSSLAPILNLPETDSIKKLYLEIKD
ncbi:MAG: hypothetical protein AAFQ87_18760 [Bacteroidota bacterium]